MRCVVSSSSTSFPWLVFFFAAVLWGSIIHRHTGRWMWRRTASVVSWNWETYSCSSKLVSTLSMLLVSVLFWTVSQAWNPRQIQMSTRNWSLWLFQASARLLWSPCWCRWSCLSSKWSSRHWSAYRRRWRLCRDTQLILPVLPLLLSIEVIGKAEIWGVWSDWRWCCTSSLLSTKLHAKPCWRPS